jgi:multidrug efflux pump subunit AcrB
MALNISAWSIEKPLPAIVFSILVLVLGAFSFSRLPITRLPNVDVPLVSVTVTQFGAAPAELEGQVTKTVEDAVSGVTGVRHIESTIIDGVSNTVVTFNLETNPDRALNDIKDAVTRVRANLPQGVDEPLVRHIDIVGLPIVTYAARAPGMTLERLSYFVDDVVKRRLQGVRGVGSVERIGGVDREIRVSLDPDRLQAVDLTAAGVSRALHDNNVDLASGTAEIGGVDQSIRTLAGARTLDELKGTMISLPGGGEVRLDTLGAVVDTSIEPRTFARLDGEPIVAFSISRSKGASDVTVAEDVAQKVAEIQRDAQKDYPGVDLVQIDTSVKHTRGLYEDAITTLYAGAALAVIIVFLFLRDLRATLIAAVALPLSIFPAFWAMDALGFSLNLISLLAITLSTGILVDDAIVEIENIARHMQMGKSAYEAAREAADEIGLAVIAISLAIVAVFAPTSFMGGVAGQFMKQFGITVAVQVLFSLLVARLVTPLLAAYFLRPHAHKEEREGRIMRLYTRLVSWSVNHRFLTVLIGLVLFAGSVYGALLLPRGYLPVEDMERSLLAIELPSGSQLRDTEIVTERIIKMLHGRPEIDHVFVDGGRIPPSTREVRMAALIISYVPRSARKLSQDELEQQIGRDLAEVPDIRYWFLDENGQRPVTLVVTGKDGATVGNVAADLAKHMERLPGIANVVSSTSLERPELHISLHRSLAARLGVSTLSLATTLRVATIGDVGPQLAKFNANGRQVPIRVLIEDTGRSDPQVLKQLRVPTGGRGTVPLYTIADIKLAEGPISINRYDRERRAKVQADLVGTTALGEALQQINDLPLMKSLPQPPKSGLTKLKDRIAGLFHKIEAEETAPDEDSALAGIRVQPAGDAETMNEVFSGLTVAMGAGLMMVYAVLVLLFASFLQPITILFSLPLSIGGAAIALILTGTSITMPVAIGILMLMGIVTKNAILLVDFAIESIAAGTDRRTAIIEAGRKRARPIIMTTIAMVAGMLPAALAFGAGGEFRAPMAIAVIGGLVVSTLLSLVFVPALFTVMDDFAGRLWRLGRRFISSGEPARPAAPTAPAPQPAPERTEPGWGVPREAGGPAE